MSLAGIPPFSGFAAKFGLFDATAREEQWPILAVAVLVSLLTLFSIFKIWIGVFWAPREASPDPADEPQPVAVAALPDTPRDGYLASRRPAIAPVSEPAVRPMPGPMPRLMVAPTAVLAILTLGIGVAAGPLYELRDRAAADLVDPSHYREAVLGP
jgi:multicomponent Na+:H+ antiporter subunit D